jgi:predicted nucleotidyltransferase
MISLIAQNKSAIVELCERFHVSRLSVFGSAARDDFDAARSDIDLLVEFDPSADPVYARNYREFRRELEQALGKRVDLLSDQVIRNPYLRRSIEANRVQLYAA